MKASGFFRRLLCLLMVSLLVFSFAQAESVDLASLSDDEIVTLLTRINQELVTRGIQKSAELPAGMYTGGTDIPAGTYILTCKTDANHHGIVWVSAASDNLNNSYPSILYEHVSFSEEEQFRIRLEEGGILNLPFPATLTISAGVQFK